MDWNLIYRTVLESTAAETALQLNILSNTSPTIANLAKSYNEIMSVDNDKDKRALVSHWYYTLMQLMPSLGDDVAEDYLPIVENTIAAIFQDNLIDDSKLLDLGNIRQRIYGPVEAETCEYVWVTIFAFFWVVSEAKIDVDISSLVAVWNIESFVAILFVMQRLFPSIIPINLIMFFNKDSMEE